MRRRPGARGRRDRVALAWAAGLLVAYWLAPQAARADDGDDDGDGPWQVGALLGGGFYQINAPQDPPGSLTFLFGSAFSGGGFTGGGTAVFEPVPLFGLEADLLLSRMSVTGSADAEGQRREITLEELDLRLALLGRLRLALPNPEIELGLGVELAAGLGSAVQETVDGPAGDEAPLTSQTSVWLMPIAQLGADIDAGPVVIPILVRAGWSPGYPDTTADRFESLADPNAPGPFTVGEDWYVSALAGVRFEL